MADGPMSAEEFQREFTLNLALSALRSTPADSPWQAVAEGWIQIHVADLKAKAKVAAMIVRVAVTEVRPGDTVVFTLRDAPLSLHDYAVVHETVERLVRDRFGPDVKSLVVDGADVSVLRAAEAAHRAVPVRGSHDLSPQIREDEPRSLFSTGGAGQPAPEHLSEGRLAQADEERCGASSETDTHRYQATCDRERWHTGPHMDRTAIAHAGKAGKVWG